MKRILKPKWYVEIVIKTVVIIFVLVLSIAFNGSRQAFAVPQGASVNYSRVPDVIPSLLLSHTPLSRTAGNRVLHLTVALIPRNEQALDALLSAQSSPTSPLYHHYLTPQEFKNQFGQTPAAIARVDNYLRSQHLDVTSVSPNNLLLNATGTVAVADKAFLITINNYQFNNRVVFAPALNPAVPDAITSIIQNIAGLDNVATYKYHALPAPPQKIIQHAGPGGGYTPSDLRTAYDANPLMNAGATGTGQTVGIFELDGYNPSDINTYLSKFNLGAAKYSNVLIDGATNTPGSGAVEVTLDMEIVSALAPNAAQKIYIGPNSSAGVNDIYNKMVTDNIAKVISTSWGQCETQSGNAELGTLNNIFKQGAAQGQSFFAASGDAGAYDCNDGSKTLAVDSPADQPYVVGVGGTNLSVGSGSVYGSESAWSSSNNSQNSGGGGGISTSFLRPAYQNGSNLTATNRLVPDVSADADPSSGYSIFCSGNGDYCNGWGVIGGTSAAAPLWAAFATDMNQYLLSQNKSPLGNVNAALYTLYNASQPYVPYHDVTTGNNLYYQAASGYDSATGIGTPDVWNIARDIAGVIVGVPTPTPPLSPTPTPPSSPPVVTPTPGGLTMQLLQNADFEHENVGWWQRSARRNSLINRTKPHSGVFSAALCGYANCNDELYQTINVPSTTKHIQLSYWVYIGNRSLPTACTSNLYVIVRTTAGNPLAFVQDLCNTGTSGWVQYTADLSSVLARYAGRSVQLYFNAHAFSQNPAAFYVDDVDFNVTRSN